MAVALLHLQINLLLLVKILLVQTATSAAVRLLVVRMLLGILQPVVLLVLM